MADSSKIISFYSFYSSHLLWPFATVFSFLHYFYDTFHSSNLISTDVSSSTLPSTSYPLHAAFLYTISPEEFSHYLATNNDPSFWTNLKVNQYCWSHAQLLSLSICLAEVEEAEAVEEWIWLTLYFSWSCLEMQ